MARRRLGVTLTALVLVGVVAVAAGFIRTPQHRFAGTVYLGMDSPLTGPVSFVGKDNVEIVQAYVKYINAHGGIKGRKLVVDVLDDASNPSTGVQNLQKFINDSKYVGFIGPGFSSISLADLPLASQAGLPTISMSSTAAQVTPAKPFWYMTTATTRLFAYATARYLRAKKLTKIALMGDVGGFGREGVKNVKELASRFGFQIVADIAFPLTSTSFTSELTKVKDSGAQALWIWNATTATITITKEARQLGLPQTLVYSGAQGSTNFTGPACPDENGAVIATYIGPVSHRLPKSNPSVKRARFAEKLIGHQGSTFHFDGFTAVDMFRTAMLRGGFTRDGINRALETKLRGFVGPGGKYYYSRVDHAGLKVASMVISRISGCQMRPVFGTPLRKTKK